MGLEDILAKTNKKLEKKSKGKNKTFSFGHDIPGLASQEGSGDAKLWIPSGIHPLDCALGGGLATGRVTELFSDDEGEGKTTAVIHFEHQVQKIGGTVVHFESESALDKVRASAIGLNLKDMIKWTPDTLEDGFRYLGELIQSISEDKDKKGKPTLIVWDTIAMARTESERDGDAFRDGIVAGPRSISIALKNYVQELTAYNVHLLLVNQSYTDIGNPKSKYLGTQYKTPGGKRIKFAASYRIKTKKNGYIGTGRTVGPKDERLGIKVRVSIPKNKMALPYRSIDLFLYGNTGYNSIMSMANMFLDSDSPYQWTDGCEVLPGGRYRPINSLKSFYWWELEKGVASQPDVLKAWEERWLQYFPIHPSRQKNEDGWYERVEGVDINTPTTNSILSNRGG